MDELVEGVFVFPHRHVEGKNAIVFGASAALAVDGCMYREEGDEMASFIRERRRRPDLLAVTHGHPDHILGSHAFRDGEVIAHTDHEALIQRVVERHAAGTERDPEEILGEIARPTVTFSEEHRVDLGDRELLMFHTPGHTPDSACVYLADQRLLIGGDTVVTGILPAFTDGDSRTLEKTLRRIAAIEVDHLVPGHGPVVSGRVRVRGWVVWLADYLACLRSQIQDLGVDTDDEEIVAATPFEEFVEGRLQPDAHGMVKRHRTALLTMARELRAEPGLSPPT